MVMIRTASTAPPLSRPGQVLVLALLLAGCGEPPTTLDPGSDLVLRGGRIYTVDDRRSWAQAVAVDHGRIVYVGSDAGVAAFIGSETEVVELSGRMVLPGFQDSHIHPISSGVEAAACDLNGLAGVAQYRAAINAYASANPDAPWILGGGWSMSVFGPGATPSRRILDEIVPNRPVYLSSQDGHTAWVNTVALELAGIDRNTPDPADGRIDRDPVTGEAIGSLQEGAMDLVASLIPPNTPQQNLAGLLYATRMLNSLGITAMQDAAVSPESLATYAEAERTGQLTLRVVTALRWDRGRDRSQLNELISLREQYRSRLIDTGSVEIMQDGVMENYTAAMLEPYLLPDGTRGIPMIDPQELKRIVSELDGAGFQVHFHAIGDAAIRQSLDAVEQARIDNGERGNRHHISHLQLIDPADIPRFRELDVVANFQPLWAFADLYITELTLPFIGEQRARWLYPIRSVLDSGATVAFGSDWSVSSPNPFEQIETAVLRKDALNGDDVPFIPEERIDLASAIAAFTINAAFVNRLEQETGSVEAGKFADLIVLDQNLFDVAPEAISDTRVLLTLLQGRPVYGSLNLQTTLR